MPARHPGHSGIGPFLLILACLGCAENMGSATHLVADRLLVAFPAETAPLGDSTGEVVAHGLMFEDARSFDILGDTIAISDASAGRVHIFTSNGRHLRTLGGPQRDGTGPNVLNAPTTVRFASDGTLWVEDMGSDRVIQFSSSLDLVSDAHLAPSGVPAGFAVDPILGLVTGATEPGFVLTVHGEERMNVPADVPLPEELTRAPTGFDLEPLPPAIVAQARHEFGSSFQVASAGRGKLVLLDGPNLKVWRVDLAYDPPRIVGIEEIAIPPWLLGQLRRDREEFREAFGGLAPVAFNSMRVSEGGVWLEPAGGAGIGIRGVWLPLDEADERGVVAFWRSPGVDPQGRRGLIRDGEVHTLGATGYARYDVREVDGPP